METRKESNGVMAIEEVIENYVISFGHAPHISRNLAIIDPMISMGKEVGNVFMNYFSVWVTFRATEFHNTVYLLCCHLQSADT